MAITCAADFADWYDTVARQYTDEALTAFVDKHPNFFGVLVAGTASSTFDLASVFFVDLARVGTGVASGTPGGVFQDILRVLSVVPVGKVATVGKPLLGRVVQKLSNLFYWRKLTGKLCVPISLSQALQFTGQRLLVTLEESVAAMGRTLESFSGKLGKGATSTELREALTELKAVFEELPAGAAQTWNDIVMFAESTEGVFLVSLKRLRRVAGQDVDGFHRIMVAKTADGVKIFDRKGVFDSLEELSRRYGSVDPSEFYKINVNNPLTIVKNWVLDPALANRLNAMGPLGAVAVKVGMALGFNPSVPPEVIKQEFEKFVGGRGPESLYPPPVRPPETVSVMYTHLVEGPRIKEQDWLSNIAKKWYGDMLLWPILFEFNKGPDFTNPNKMYVGQRVKVPFINDKSPQELASVRKQGLNWRNY